MRSVVVPLNEAARLELAGQGSSSSHPKEQKVTQLERSQKRLDRNIEKRQFALAQHRMEKMSLYGSTGCMEGPSKMNADHSTQQDNSENVGSSKNQPNHAQNKTEKDMGKLDLEGMPGATSRGLRKRKRDKLKMAMNRRQENAPQEGTSEVASSSKADSYGRRLQSGPGLGRHVRSRFWGRKSRSLLPISFDLRNPEVGDSTY